jgi:hypothetical protein
MSLYFGSEPFQLLLPVTGYDGKGMIVEPWVAIVMDAAAGC